VSKSRRAARWHAGGPARAAGQAAVVVAREDLVAGLARDAKLAAQHCQQALLASACCCIKLLDGVQYRGDDDLTPEDLGGG
jgi:hypothetical protein